MTEFNERIEGEIKTHEAEMLKKAVIAKYGPLSLEERIKYIMERYPQPAWSASQMFNKLTETELAGSNTLDDVKAVFSNQSDIFSCKVSTD